MSMVLMVFDVEKARKGSGTPTPWAELPRLPSLLGQGLIPPRPAPRRFLARLGTSIKPCCLAALCGRSERRVHLDRTSCPASADALALAIISQKPVD